MKTKLFVFATIFVVATLFVPAVFAAELPYYSKPIYYVTLSNRFPVTNEFAPTDFSCLIRTQTVPKIDLKAAKLIVRDAFHMSVNKHSTVIQGKIDLTVSLLVNWDTVTIREYERTDSGVVWYETVYGLEKPRFSNFPVGNTDVTAGITTGATFKILVPRHKI